MIFPVGHEESSVRRLPWVTFAIMASCIVTFLLTDTDAADLAPDRDQLMEDASSFWRDHAYLDPAHEVRTRVGYDVTPNQRKQYLDLMVDMSLDDRPDVDQEVEAEQAELDRLTDLALGVTLPDEMTSDANPFNKWGVIPEKFRFATLLTHMFIHAGWIHLISNLFILFLAGPPVEDRLGRPLFAAVYAGAGIFAALFWSALAAEKNIPMVGASGAIAGTLGAFLFLYWKAKIKFLYFFLFGFRPIYGSFHAEAWLMLPLWFGNEVLQGWVMNSLGMSGGVAYFAHVGGFIFGAGSMLSVKAFKLEERFIHDAIESKVTVLEANPLIEEVMSLRADGDDEAAMQRLHESWPENSNDRDVALALWDTARMVGRPEEGVEAARALIHSSSSDEDKSVAIQHWLDLTGAFPFALVSPAALMRFVPVFCEDDNPELAVRAMRHATDPGNEGLTTGLAMKAIELAREIDPPSALRAARRAIASPELHEVKRERLQGLIDELIAAGCEDVPDVAAEECAQQESNQHRSLDLSIDDSEQPSGPSLGRTPRVLPEDDYVRDEGIAVQEIDLAGSISRFSGTKVVDATPVALGNEALQIKVGPDRVVDVDFRKIQAVSVVALEEPGGKPILVIDLLLNWNTLEDEALRVIRVTSTTFNPRVLIPGVESSMLALRRLIGEIAQRSNATILPSPELLDGAPFQVFADLASYHQQVLQVQG